MALAIFIPAYQAQHTLAAVIHRIPPETYNDLSELLIQDDGSTDETYQAALELKRLYSKITVIRNEVNLGYGGTKKKAYRYLIDRGADPIVLLHGDGQHRPEAIPALVEPIIANRADIVLGSRMIADPLQGGMPTYKYIGNRILTSVVNCALRVRLTDPHTGFRAYTSRALREIGFENCGNGHEISAELIFRAVEHRLRIQEVPVDTIYTPEARQCSFRTSVAYGIHVVGLGLHKLRAGIPKTLERSRRC